MPTYGEIERIKELTFDSMIEKSDREKTLEWWNRLTIHLQNQLYLTYFGCKATDQFPDEIEQIWRRETQQESFEDISADVMREYKSSIVKKERPQVDFEMLKRTEAQENSEFIAYCFNLQQRYDISKLEEAIKAIENVSFSQKDNYSLKMAIYEAEQILKEIKK